MYQFLVIRRLRIVWFCKNKGCSEKNMRFGFHGGAAMDFYYICFGQSNWSFYELVTHFTKNKYF